jgi:hypothetical protein
MVIVDTSVWIDYLNLAETPETAWLDQELSRQRLGLLDIVLAEVLQGAGAERQAQALQRELLKFEVFATGGVDLAVAVGRHYRALRRRGITIRKTIDVWIATYCILQNLTLLHKDRDFDPFEQYLGLAVIHVGRGGAGARA